MQYFKLALLDKNYNFFAFFISGSDETPPACQSDESVAAALKDIKMAIQATRVLQHQTRIIPSNSNSNNSNMNPTAVSINSAVVSSTVNLTSIELVKYRVVKSQPSFPQILHISPILDNITQPLYIETVAQKLRPINGFFSFFACLRFLHLCLNFWTN